MLQLVVLLLLFLPYHVDTCLVVRTVEPLKCYCPPIGYMDRDGILQMESAAYLGNRSIFYPKSVNVSDNCTLTVDAPASDGFDDYYFMIFRSNGPPIFNKRFKPGFENSTVPFNPTGITCAKSRDDYQWHFYGAPIENMTFALQSNEEQCGCLEWKNMYGNTVPFSALYNTCDIIRFDCPESYPVVYTSNFESIHRTINDLTCVNNQWYYNNGLQYSTGFACEILPWFQDSEPWPCGCHSAQNMGTSFWLYTSLISAYPEYGNYIFSEVSATYSSEDDFCTPHFHCLPNETLIIFTSGYKTFSYTNGTEPIMSCHPTPLATSSESQRFWFVNGMMADVVSYGCYSIPVQNCSCSFEYLNESNIQELVGSHPFYQTIASYAILSPNDTYSDGNVCPEQVICPSGLALVVFDTDDAKVYPSGSLNVSCSGTTNNWTVDDVELEVLYATCVNYSEPQCKCPPIKQLTNSRIANNSYWKLLKNEVIWNTSVTYSSDCDVEFSCAGTGLDSYYTAIFYAGAPPIVINRVVNDVITTGSGPQMTCVERSDGQYGWQIYGYSVEDLSVTCVSDMDSCKCPAINASAKLGELPYLIDRSSPVGKYCGFLEATCPSGGEPKIVSDTLNPITPQGRSIFDELVCVTKDDGSHQWHFGAVPLVNPSVSCVPTGKCACGELVAVNQKSELSNYDTSGDFDGYTVAQGNWSYDDCRETVEILCPNGYLPVVFGNGIDWFSINVTKTIKCVDNPASSDLKIWYSEGKKVLNPAIACIENKTETSCACPYASMNKTNILQTVGRFHPSLPNITDHPFQAPDSNGEGACPEQISCPENYTLVVFDTSSATSFPNGSLTASCSETTNNWTVNDIELDSLYTTCVDFSVRVCNCEPIPLLENNQTLSTVGDDCSLQFLCDSDVLVYNFNFDVFTVQSNDTTNFSCRWTPESSSFNWFYNDDLLNTPSYNCSEPQCKCPPIELLTNSQIANNSYWKLRKNEVIWNTSVTYSSDCGVEFFCAGTGLDSYYTAIFYANAPPIVVNRVVNDVITTGSGPPMTCVERSDGQYGWQIYGYPVEDLSVTCVSDMDSCKCPAINASTKLGELPSITDRSSPVGKYCGSIEASCHTGGKPKIVSDNLKPITPQGKSISDELVCLEKDDGSHQWHFGVVPLVNPSISCVPTGKCACGELVAVNQKSELSNYDTSGDFEDYTVAQGNWSYDDCRETVEIKCPNGYLPVVFGSGIDWFYINTTKTIKCVDDPASSDLKIWFSEGREVVNPAIACIKKDTETTCSCPYVYMDKTNILQTVGMFHPSLRNITDYLFRAPVNSGESGCPEQISCPENFTLVVFDNSNATLFPNGIRIASCSETTRSWTLDDIQMNTLYSVCVNFNVDARHGCLCPLISASGAASIYGGMIVLGWYAPMITYGDDCQPEFSCAGAGVDSYISVLYNANFDPLYTNRVVDGVSLSSLPEPRTVPGLQCSALLGNNWEYIDFLDNGVTVSCYHDTLSCDCPSISANDNAGKLATLKNRSSGDQCGFIEVECPDGYVPTLLSDEAKPIFALGKPVFNELICLDQQGGILWSYSDVTLVNPSISCAPRPSSCLCEDIVVIRTDEQLKSYQKFGYEIDSNHVVESPWNFTECVSSIALTCSGTPIIYSNEFNYPRKAEYSNVLQCIPSPMDEDVYMWFFDGFRVINPAIACV